MKKMLNILIVLLIAYGAIVLFFYFSQSSMLFYPQPISYQVQLHENLEEITIPSSDGKHLHGWLSKNPDTQHQKLLIYFGGNAEEVSHMITMATLFEGWALLLINYPGYGNSHGKPGEKSFYDAALKIYDYAAAREDIDTTNIVVMGRSIGSGSAVYLAHERETKAVVLISPFESISSVARSRLPFLPIDVILRHKFNSQKYAKNISVPLLVFYGTNDNIIPPQHSKELAENWKGRTTVEALDGYGHNDIFENQRMWEEINWFLKGL